MKATGKAKRIFIAVFKINIKLRELWKAVNKSDKIISLVNRGGIMLGRL